MNPSKPILFALALAMTFAAPALHAEEEQEDQGQQQIGQYVPAADNQGGYIDVGSSGPAAQDGEEEDEVTKRELEELKAYVEEIQRSTRAGRDGQAAAEAAKTVQQVQQIKNVQQSYKF